MASRERAFTVTNGVISYGAQLSAYGYQYDACNNLSKLTCSVLGSTWSTIYTYDGDNRAATTTLSSGTVLTNTYDTLGRLSNRAIGLNTTYNTALTYVPGNATHKTTGLVATYRNGSDDAYNYTYDAVGNISSITRGSSETDPITYVYDSANRLIRENDSVTNITTLYEYDSWGNIQNKKLYVYTTAENLGDPVVTVPYAYSNTAWGDQLTSYDGQTITYDSMGNPTSYRGYEFTWRGKQLVGATTATHTVSFEYNEDGLRQKKTFDGLDTNYYYNGSVLIGMQRGMSTFLFSYDAAGNVVSVKFITANDTNEYYYLRNAQGDIVKLIDASGVSVVEYTYNTWGKKVTTTGTLAGTLGLLQPFRYRGYVYDWELGLYYLESRYYDPAVGRFISADVLLSTGQGVLGHNCYAYCLGNPVCYIDDGGYLAAPWWALLGDWGAIHRKVQEVICRKYKHRGMTSEVPLAGGRIDLKDENGYIWEVKPAGTPMDIIDDQLNRYLNGKDGTKRGGYILPYTTVESIDGFKVSITYWQPVRGVIYYTWDFADSEAIENSYMLYKAWKAERETIKLQKPALSLNYGRATANSSLSIGFALGLSAAVIMTSLVISSIKSGGGGKDRTPQMSF